MVVKFIIRRAAHSQVIIYCNFISITILIQRHDRDSRSKKKCVCVCAVASTGSDHILRWRIPKDDLNSMPLFILWWFWQITDSDASIDDICNLIPLLFRTHRLVRFWLKSYAWISYIFIIRLKPSVNFNGEKKRDTTFNKNKYEA